MSEIIVSAGKKFLHISGFIYYYHYTSKKGSPYWQCCRKNECSARAITLVQPDKSLIVRKGPQDSIHCHAPNREEVSAISGIKRRVADYLKYPAGILAELRDRECQKIN